MRCCETCSNVPCKILDRVPCSNQSERDKVLSELDKHCDDWISQIKEIDIDGYSDPTAVEKIDLLQYIKGELHELRKQAGERG